MLKPGDKAPDFECPCALDGHAGRAALSGIRSELVLLFFYPRDFSFICPTEVSAFARAIQDFKDEGCTVLGASVDTVESHIKWAEQLGGVPYPLLADEDRTLTRAFDVLDEKEKVALRATFIFDRDRTVVYALASPINIGRSIRETLRVVRAIRTGHLCPAEWTPGVQFGPADLKY